MVEAITSGLPNLSFYPDWSARVLREKIENKCGYDPGRVICGAGETEIISCIILAFASSDEKLLMQETCFPLYHKFAAAEGRVPVTSLWETISNSVSTNSLPKFKMTCASSS